MIEPLENCEPLSQVWFVHDYIQLQFQDKTVTVINEPQLKLPSGEAISRKDIGFCDHLVGLIGLQLDDSQFKEHNFLSLKFSNMAELIIPLTKEAAKGPEAVEIGAWIIFNA